MTREALTLHILTLMCCRGVHKARGGGWGGSEAHSLARGMSVEVFLKCSHFPSFPSLPFPECQSLIGPVPPQSSEVPSPRTELQEYRTQNTKQIGGGLPASMVRDSPVARAISGFSLQGLGSVQQRALGSLGQLSVGVGECITLLLPRAVQEHRRRGREYGQQWVELMGRLESGWQFH